MAGLHVLLDLQLLGLALILLYVFANLIQAIYNVTLHPLARHPGPKLAGATPLPYAYYRLRGEQHQWIKALHDYYGPTVRYLPDTLSYINPDAWSDIFGHKPHNGGDMPKDKAVKMAFIGGDHSIMRMDEADHSRVRRLLAPALSEKALREQQEILNTYVQQLVAKIREVAAAAAATSRSDEHAKIDIMRWYNFTTFDIIADLAFGEPLGMLKQGEWTSWIFAINKSIPVSTNIAAIARYFPMVGTLSKYFLGAETFKPLETHIKYSRDQVDKRLVRGADRPDFWKYILRNQNSESGSLSTAENHALGMTLMVAGSETTAALLGGLTNYLLNNHDKYQRLVNEIRAAFKSPEDINMDSLAQLPYLFACLQEGLRLYPPTPIGQQRVVPKGGRTVCGQYVGEGTFVTISHWAAYRDAGYWHRAEDFCPERWLSENLTSGPFAKDRRDVLNPFSFGPRNCIGKNLAYHEARLILVNVLWNFDIELCDESRNWADQKVFGLAQRGPLMVKPTAVVYTK